MKRGRWMSGLVAVVAVAVAACATTQKAEIKQSDFKCAFLGSDCQKLAPGAKDEAALRYVNPDANWKQYKAILLDPVTFWGGETTKVSVEDQKILADYFSQVLREELGKKLSVVDQPGPGVMRVQVALTDAEAATPGLRTISTVVPQARLLNSLKYAATGTYAFVGGAQVEARVTDAVSGQLLAAVADRRVGGGSMETAAQWQWGDAENAMKAWAATAADRLLAWTSGTPER